MNPQCCWNRYYTYTCTCMYMYIKNSKSGTSTKRELIGRVCTQLPFETHYWHVCFIFWPTWCYINYGANTLWSIISCSSIGDVRTLWTGLYHAHHIHILSPLSHIHNTHTHKQVVGNCGGDAVAPSVPHTIWWDCTLYTKLCHIHYCLMRYNVQIHRYTHKWKYGCVNCACYRYQSI